ncbi:MAG: GNAT family N-acetyltransferase [Candidatus Thermoplasmatota archaeon]|nr:GNAT family N-acetyltransferase [Candidatus Thermoplasmatota archaeon]
MTGTLIIRRVEATDLEPLTRMANSRLREDYSIELLSHLYENQSGCFLTALDDDGLIGFIVGVPMGGSSLRILMLAVKRSRTRQGVGSELMRSAEAYASLRKMSSVVLEVGTRNDEALGFYKNLGYSITALIPEYYRDRSDAFVMRKFISM